MNPKGQKTANRKECSWCNLLTGMVWCRDCYTQAICYNCSVTTPTAGMCPGCLNRFKTLHGKEVDYAD